MSGVAIRPVHDGDEEVLVALWREVFPEYADPTRPQRDPSASIRRKLAFGDGLFWLAERDGAVVGSAMAGYDGHRGWIYSLGVHPSRRGQGIGRALVAHVERELRALGCPKINLQVLDAKDGSIAFWRAVGYVQDPVVSFGRRI